MDYLNDQLAGVKPNSKHSSEEVLQKWRDMCDHVKSPKRRFCFTANVHKCHEAAAIMPPTNQNLRVAVLVSKAAFHLLKGVEASSHTVPEEFKTNGFGISADDAGSIVEGRNPEKLKLYGGVDGLAAKLKTCTTNGLAMDDKELACRQQLFGTNEFNKRKQSFRAVCAFVLLVVVCAFVSLIVGIATEGWPAGAVFVASILLVVFVTAISNYHQSLTFRDEKIFIQVTRSGYKQKLSVYKLLPGDIVHLAVGDQVPADGLILSGFVVSVDESSLTGESEMVEVNTGYPYLLCGTTVQDGSCKMLVVTVGMRTQWGKLKATLTKGGIDETRYKLN